MPRPPHHRTAASADQEAGGDDPRSHAKGHEGMLPLRAPSRPFVDQKAYFLFAYLRGSKGVFPLRAPSWIKGVFSLRGSSRVFADQNERSRCLTNANQQRIMLC